MDNEVLYFLPSEIARLVLGYLQTEGCTSTYKIFLKECPYLKEYLSLLRRGQSCSLKINSMTLVDILEEYGLLKTSEISRRITNPNLTSLWKQFDSVVDSLKKQVSSKKFIYKDTMVQSSRTRQNLRTVQRNKFLNSYVDESTSQNSTRTSADKTDGIMNIQSSIATPKTTPDEHDIAMVTMEDNQDDPAEVDDIEADTEAINTSLPPLDDVTARHKEPVDMNSNPTNVTGGTVNSNPANVTGSTVNSNPANVTGGTVNSNPTNVTGGTVNSNPANVTGGTVNSNPANVTGGTVNSNPTNVIGGTTVNSNPTEAQDVSMETQENTDIRDDVPEDLSTLHLSGESGKKSEVPCKAWPSSPRRHQSSESDVAKECIVQPDNVQPDDQGKQSQDLFDCTQESGSAVIQQTPVKQTLHIEHEKSPRRKRPPKRKSLRDKKKPVAVTSVQNESSNSTDGSVHDNFAGQRLMNELLNNPMLTHKLAENINKSLHPDAMPLPPPSLEDDYSNIDLPESCLEDILDLKETRMSSSQISGIISRSKQDPDLGSLLNVFDIDDVLGITDSTASNQGGGNFSSNKQKERRLSTPVPFDTGALEALVSSLKSKATDTYTDSQTSVTNTAGHLSSLTPCPSGSTTLCPSGSQVPGSFVDSACFEPIQSSTEMFNTVTSNTYNTPCGTSTPVRQSAPCGTSTPVRQSAPCGPSTPVRQGAPSAFSPVPSLLQSSSLCSDIQTSHSSTTGDNALQFECTNKADINKSVELSTNCATVQSLVTMVTSHQPISSQPMSPPTTTSVTSMAPIISPFSPEYGPVAMEVQASPHGFPVLSLTDAAQKESSILSPSKQPDRSGTSYNTTSSDGAAELSSASMMSPADVVQAISTSAKSLPTINLQSLYDTENPKQDPQKPRKGKKGTKNKKTTPKNKKSSEWSSELSALMKLTSPVKKIDKGSKSKSGSKAKSNQSSDKQTFFAVLSPHGKTVQHIPVVEVNSLSECSDATDLIAVGTLVSSNNTRSSERITHTSPESGTSAHLKSSIPKVLSTVTVDQQEKQFLSMPTLQSLAKPSLTPQNVSVPQVLTSNKDKETLSQFELPISTPQSVLHLPTSQSSQSKPREQRTPEKILTEPYSADRDFLESPQSCDSRQQCIDFNESTGEDLAQRLFVNAHTITQEQEPDRLVVDNSPLKTPLEKQTGCELHVRSLNFGVSDCIKSSTDSAQVIGLGNLPPRSQMQRNSKDNVTTPERIRHLAYGRGHKNPSKSLADSSSSGYVKDSVTVHKRSVRSNKNTSFSSSALSKLRKSSSIQNSQIDNDCDINSTVDPVKCVTMTRQEFIKDTIQSGKLHQNFSTNNSDHEDKNDNVTVISSCRESAKKITKMPASPAVLDDLIPDKSGKVYLSPVVSVILSPEKSDNSDKAGKQQLTTKTHKNKGFSISEENEEGTDACHEAADDANSADQDSHVNTSCEDYVPSNPPVFVNEISHDIAVIPSVFSSTGSAKQSLTNRTQTFTESFGDRISKHTEKAICHHGNSKHPEKAICNHGNNARTARNSSRHKTCLNDSGEDNSIQSRDIHDDQDIIHQDLATSPDSVRGRYPESPSSQGEEEIDVTGDWENPWNVSSNRNMTIRHCPPGGRECHDVRKTNLDFVTENVELQDKMYSERALKLLEDYKKSNENVLEINNKTVEFAGNSERNLQQSERVVQNSHRKLENNNLHSVPYKTMPHTTVREDRNTSHRYVGNISTISQRHTTSQPTNSSLQHNTPQPTNSSSRHNTPQPTNSSSRHNTPQPTNSSLRHNTPQPTNSSSRHNTPQPTNSSLRHNTPQPKNSSSRHNTPQPTNSSLRHNTPQPTKSSSRHITSQPTNSSLQHNTLQPTDSSSRHNTTQPANSSSRHNTSQQGTHPTVKTKAQLKRISFKKSLPSVSHATLSVENGDSEDSYDLPDLSTPTKSCDPVKDTNSLSRNSTNSNRSTSSNVTPTLYQHVTPPKKRITASLKNGDSLYFFSTSQQPSKTDSSVVDPQKPGVSNIETHGNSSPNSTRPFTTSAVNSPKRSRKTKLTPRKEVIEQAHKSPVQKTDTRDSRRSVSTQSEARKTKRKRDADTDCVSKVPEKKSKKGKKVVDLSKLDVDKFLSKIYK